MMCCCDKCRFVFESIRLLDRCPDCGAESVRQATEEEAAEYAANREKYGPMLVYGISNLFPVKEVEMPFIVGAKNGCPVYEMRRTIVPVVSM
jgi:predicted  nucleic acid-binding Zn-ribbon protein